MSTQHPIQRPIQHSTQHPTQRRDRSSTHPINPINPIYLGRPTADNQHSPAERRTPHTNDKTTTRLRPYPASDPASDPAFDPAYNPAADPATTQSPPCYVNNNVHIHTLPRSTTQTSSMARRSRYRAVFAMNIHATTHPDFPDAQPIHPIH